MVMSFFRKGTEAVGLEHIEARAVTMLGDARHSFDLANLALLAGVPPDSVATDIRSTDTRINQAEQDLRSELVVHVSVQGTSDIGSVLGIILLLKKIERIGDQAKNILDLAEAGVTLADSSDIAELQSEQQEVSALYGTAAELLAKTDKPSAEVFVIRVTELIASYQAKINSYMFSDQPARQVVPRVIYYRYLKRIVANLRGVVGVALNPLPHIDYLHSGETDTDD